MTIARTSASRPRGLRRVLTLATMVATAVALTTAAPASSWATVDENKPGYQEPTYQSTGAATEVYSLQLIQTPTIGGAASAGGGASVKSGTISNPHLTVSKGATANAEPVTTWTGGWNSDFAEAEYLQANQLWEFIPTDDNAGGTLESGYGHLRNRDTGKCLQVNGAVTSDVGVINQWDCIPTARNEMWQLVSNFRTGGKPKLTVRHSGAWLGLNTSVCGNNQSATPDGNLQYLVARESKYRTHPCAVEIKAQRAAYAFATNKVDVALYDTARDNAKYECLQGYGKLYLDASGNGSGKSFGALFDTERLSYIGYLYKNLSEYGTKPVESLAYYNNEHFDVDVPYWTKGQILIPCYPK